MKIHSEQFDMFTIMIKVDETFLCAPIKRILYDKIVQAIITL